MKYIVMSQKKFTREFFQMKYFNSDLPFSPISIISISLAPPAFAFALSLSLAFAFALPFTTIEGPTAAAAATRLAPVAVEGNKKREL